MESLPAEIRAEQELFLNKPVGKAWPVYDEDTGLPITHNIPEVNFRLYQFTDAQRNKGGSDVTTPRSERPVEVFTGGLNAEEMAKLEDLQAYIEKTKGKRGKK